MRMQRFSTFAVAALMILSIAMSARGAEPLTLESALAIARERAPSIVAERMRLDEARARATRHSRALTSNPELDASLGRRESGDGAERWDEWEVGLSQNLGDLVRGPARGDSAAATLEAELRSSDDASRAVLLEVADTFIELLSLEHRHRLACESGMEATKLHDAAVRRFEAGDVAQIDVNLATTLAARAATEQLSLVAEMHALRARLASLLGIDDVSSIVIANDRLTLPDLPPWDDVETLSASRPDILRLDAEIAATRSELRLASLLRALDWSLVATVGEEEGDSVATAGLNIALPFVDSGRFARSEANARLARLEHQRAALARSAALELDGAYRAYGALREHAARTTDSLLPLLSKNDSLATESYEAGQIGIGELATIRRESIETRDVFITNWLEARRAALRLQFLSGELR